MRYEAADRRRRAEWFKAQRRAEEKLERKMSQASITALVFAFIAVLGTGPTLVLMELTDSSLTAFLGSFVIISLLGTVFWSGKFLYLGYRKKNLIKRWGN